LVQEKRILKQELKFAMEARDNNAMKIKDLKIELAEYDAKTEVIRQENTKLKDKITMLEVERLKMIKDVTGMKLQLEEQ
jgi:hypothetical protein